MFIGDYPLEIGGFTVLGLLGRGAASVIYAVKDPSTNQVYALKHVVKRNESDQRFIDQALAEHEIGSKLDHPNLRKSVRIIRQRQFLRVTEVLLLLEMVDGVNMKESRPRTLTNMIKVFRAVAKGLQAMHDAGYAHADMKPINILRTKQHGVKVIDFGQSCPLGTIKRRIQGTPDFIAPEQIALDPITRLTDVYNLGATMYWCVTDRNVPAKFSRRRGEVIIDSEPMRDPIYWRPEIPGALNSLILDCIKEDPRLRPRSMEAVRERLAIALHQLEPKK